MDILSGLVSSLSPVFNHELATGKRLRRQDDSSACVSPDPANTLTDRMNIALNSSGAGYVLSLCQNTQYPIEAPINFAFPDQEISTVGYPTGDERATLVVNGPVFNGTGHTTAIQGTCPTCSGIRIRNIQINGTRAGSSPTGGGANIEIGGDNSDQLVEHVHSYDPRSWSCLHIFEGTLQCANAVIRNNDIGPCGTDTYMEWADGISVSCRNTTVTNNTIVGATDGGVVLFGAPGSLVENNTIQALANTQLGGVNMVDVTPWGGDYSGTIVQNNLIVGGLADPTSGVQAETGTNADGVILKMGIAIGPRTYFVDFFQQNVSASGTVLNNNFTGAFGYAMAVSGARNFTVQGNSLVGNTSFISSSGPNCTEGITIPDSSSFVVSWPNVTDTSLQTSFTGVDRAEGLTCIVPQDGARWPYDTIPPSTSSNSSSQTSQPASSGGGGGGGLSGGAKAGIAVGVIVGVFAIAVAAWIIRRRAIRRTPPSRMY
ncbi:hypothetical protein PENSPDRAFT_646571 [Peniophora sp. CONT]|nr:hypothetical protein PENSPDRAFT_646571 [Peniophora sp. CONT]